MTLMEWLEEQRDAYYALRDETIANEDQAFLGQLAARYDANAALCARIYQMLCTASFDDYAVLQVGDTITRGKGTPSEHHTSTSTTHSIPEG